MAITAKRHRSQDSASTPTLVLAFAWGVRTWRLGFTTGAAPPGTAGAGGSGPHDAGRDWPGQAAL
jgi:hypothetical protein